MRAEKKTVDENHPVVVQLMSKLNYSMEQSVDAVARYGSLEGALTYLELKDTEDEDKLFHFSVAESPDDSFKMYVGLFRMYTLYMAGVQCVLCLAIHIAACIICRIQS